MLLAAKLVLPAAKLVQSSLPRVLNPAKARRRLPFLRRSLVVALLEKSGDDQKRTWSRLLWFAIVAPTTSRERRGPVSYTHLTLPTNREV